LRSRAERHRPSTHCVQVCMFAADESAAPALTALLIAAEPWGRRRAAALACYGGVWPSWEGEE